MNYLDRVQGVRENIGHLASEHAALVAQPHGREQVRRLVLDGIQSAVGVADGQSARMLEQLAAGLPADLLTADVSAMTAHGPMHARVDLLPIMLRLLGATALRKALVLGIEAIPEGLPTEARTERLATVTAELETLQTREERLIREAASVGEDIPRRLDADARYVLALGVEQ